jgi:hypothetical protein
MLSPEDEGRSHNSFNRPRHQTRFEHDRPFVKLQSEIVSTGLKFKENPFPFTPHCTIVKFDNPSGEIVNEILSLPTFTIINY